MKDAVLVSLAGFNVVLGDGSMAFGKDIQGIGYAKITNNVSLLHGVMYRHL